MTALQPLGIRDLVVRALQEDLGSGDVTTETLVPPDARSTAVLTAKERGVIAGLCLLEATFAELDPEVEVLPAVADGAFVKVGTVVAKLKGPTRALLMGERTALNFMQRASGIATRTRQYVRAVAGTGARICDTRKTAPGLRLLDKYAVRVGGGVNHRLGLFDAVLIKENHILVAGGISAAVRKARKSAPHTAKIEVETENLTEVRKALNAGADLIMLDNLTLAQMRRAVELIDGRAVVEASGNVSLKRVRDIAETGVDLISVGALTHSVTALDLSLRLQ